MVAKPDESPVSVAALPIGQGDAILIRWRDQDRRWTCLVDGGASAKALKQSLRDLKVEHLDLLVVTHLDSDHIAGLGDWITSDPDSFPKVDCYWGPALAAFERHDWLFGLRCREALARGRRLEDALRKRHEALPILYPLEGFSSAPWGRVGPQIEVLNPPRRLIEHLVTADDISDLLTSETAPLGWLLEPRIDEENEESLAPFARGLAQQVLEPDSFAGLKAPRIDQSLTRATGVHGVDPLFYGNQLFNNSSIVLWIDLPVGGRNHSVLLTGDLENWTYLVARHRKGLQPDLLKAPHHGGRIYFDGIPSSSEEGAEALHRYLRPKTVLVSSIGGHDLPHEATRNAWIRWGATVLCTCERGSERIVGPQPSGRCCHKNHGCSKRNEPMVVRFDADGIVASRPACHSGIGDGVAPPIIVHQQVVNPSPALEILGDLEIRRYLNWLKKKLRAMHDTRVKTGTAADGTVISSADLVVMARAAKLGPIAAHLPTVLDVGMKREVLWSEPANRRGPVRVAYTRPTASELTTFAQALRDAGLIVWPDASVSAVGDRESFILGLEHGGLAVWARKQWGFPIETFRDLFLPTVLEELRKPSWLVFRHASGGILMSHGAVPSRIETMIESLLEESKSESWALRLAVDQARQIHGDELTELFGGGQGNAREQLDNYLRERLAQWGIAPKGCKVWIQKNVPFMIVPSFLLGGQTVIIGGTSDSCDNVAGKIDIWLRPTQGALQAAGYSQGYSYEEMLRGVISSGAIWFLRDRDSWWRDKIEIYPNGGRTRISVLEGESPDRSMMEYSNLVIESFEQLA